MYIYALLGIIFISITLLVFIPVRMMSKKQSAMNKRLREVESNFQTEKKEKTVQVAQKYISSKVKQILATMPTDDTKKIKVNRTIANKLQCAGYRNESAPQVLRRLKLISAILLFFAIYLPFKYNLVEIQSIKNPLLFSLAGLLSGYLLPGIIVDYKASKRQNSISDSLPDALDFLVICVEAGLGLNAAILRTGQDIRLRSKEMSDEFELVNREMRTGQTREQALRNLTLRNNVEDLNILVQALILADKLGMGVGSTLRAQAAALRLRVRQRAEEKAAKVGIKLLFPLALFILPALFITLLGPAFITASEALK